MSCYDYEIERIKYKNHEIILSYDEVYDSVFEWENELVFISNHRDYINKNIDDNYDLSDVKDLLDEYYFVNVYAYIHSGIALSVGSFNCPWDSGLFGVIGIRKEYFDKTFNMSYEKYLTSEVELYSKQLNGECYYFKVEGTNCDDACGQFYDCDDAIEEAKNSIDFSINVHEKKLQNRLKQLIKNKVGLQYREQVLQEVG